MALAERLDRDGFAVVPGALPPGLIAELAGDVEPLLREFPAASAADRLGRELCVVNAGDALLFRPLTLHA